MILSYLRTIVLYLVLILAIRVMGKRQIGEMEPAEFVVTMLVANLAAIPMQDGGIPLLSGLIPILTVLSVELVLSAGAVLSIRIRRILCGKPVILMENGNFLPENLKSTRITLAKWNRRNLSSPCWWPIWRPSPCRTEASPCIPGWCPS